MEYLKVSKRRIYDVVNILEGIGLLQKGKKNCIIWKGIPACFSRLKEDAKINEDFFQASREISDIEKSESFLKFGYVNFKDFQNIKMENDIVVSPCYKEDAIIEKINHQFSVNLSSDKTLATHYITKKKE